MIQQKSTKGLTQVTNKEDLMSGRKGPNATK